MKQNDAPVELPNHVLVGTSTYGERRPPVDVAELVEHGCAVHDQDRLGARRRAAVAHPQVEVLAAPR